MKYVYTFPLDKNGMPKYNVQQLPGENINWVFDVKKGESRYMTNMEHPELEKHNDVTKKLYVPPKPKPKKEKTGSASGTKRTTSSSSKKTTSKKR